MRSAQAPNPPPTADRRFFQRFGLLLISLIVLGFGGRTLFGEEESKPSLSILVPHILCISGWYLLFVAQASLIRSGRRALHIRLGMTSVGLALALVITGVLVMAANYRLKGDAPLAFFNCLNLGQFVLLYVLGLRARSRRSQEHSRLLLFAGITMMPPALVRIVQTLGLPEPITVLPMLLLWWPPLQHDRQTLGRIHRGTWIGLAIVGSGLLVGPLGFTESWADLIDSVLLADG